MFFAAAFIASSGSREAIMDELTARRAVAAAKLFATRCLVLLALAYPRSGSADEIVASLWGTSMIGAPYAVAMKNGYFKSAGVSVTGVIGGAGGGNVLRTVLANSLPYGEVATPAVIAAQQGGLSVVAVNGGVLAADNVG
jgi:NitT/TauT family transport system substrate-binding protein